MSKAAKNAELERARMAEATYSSFAERAMAKMGWSKGKGLGKHEQGIEESVKVKKREDNVGLGLDSVEQQFAAGLAKRSGKASFDEPGGQWWTDAFGAALQNVQKRQGGDKVTKKAAPTMDDLFRATGGARLGMRARQSQAGKLKRSDQVPLNHAPDKQQATTAEMPSSNKEARARKNDDDDDDDGAAASKETTKKKNKKRAAEEAEDNGEDPPKKKKRTAPAAAPADAAAATTADEPASSEKKKKKKKKKKDKRPASE